MKELIKVLNYQFTNENLLKQALTHPSVIQTPHIKTAHYERLELLGDTVLSLVITELLLEKYPEDNEGALAKKRATLICGDILSNIAHQLGIHEYIIMSGGEEKAGGKTNPRILENVVEALIGAMYLDGGLEVCKKFICEFWAEALENTTAVPVDPKAYLQEWAQKSGKSIPNYAILEQEGPAHKPIFTVEVTVEDLPKFQAQGSSRKIAEKLAAEQVIIYIQNLKDESSN
jgi:ribonuclease-3